MQKQKKRFIFMTFGILNMFLLLLVESFQNTDIFDNAKFGHFHRRWKCNKSSGYYHDAKFSQRYGSNVMKRAYFSRDEIHLHFKSVAKVSYVNQFVESVLTQHFSCSTKLAEKLKYELIAMIPKQIKVYFGSVNALGVDHLEVVHAKMRRGDKRKKRHRSNYCMFCFEKLFSFIHDDDNGDSNVKEKKRFIFMIVGFLGMIDFMLMLK